MQGGELRMGRNEPGRGAWLCHDDRCLELAVGRRAFPRALRVDVTAAQLVALEMAFVSYERRARG